MFLPFLFGAEDEDNFHGGELSAPLRVRKHSSVLQKRVYDRDESIIHAAILLDEGTCAFFGYELL